jgi:hypothetical protein
MKGYKVISIREAELITQAGAPLLTIVTESGKKSEWRGFSIYWIDWIESTPYCLGGSGWQKCHGLCGESVQ